MAEQHGKPTFFCPYCNQKLSFLDGTIIKLAGRLHAKHFSCKVMFYIPAALGEFGAIVGEGARIREGAKVEFECLNGACKQNFTTTYQKNMAEIKMIDEHGEEFVVVFNKIFGRRSTFLVELKGRSLIKAFGEHAPEYQLEFNKPLNFFGY